MCKKRLGICLCILTLMITTGCVPVVKLNNEDTDIYQKIHRKFSRMTAYTATVKMTVKSNKTEQVYEMMQAVRVPGLARAELTAPAELVGLVTVYRDGEVFAYRAENETPLQVKALAEYHDVFVHEFFARYYQSEDTALSVSGNTEESRTMLLETAASPETSSRYKITMLLDTKTLEPKVITVYDMGGNVRMIAEFSEFCYNPKLEDSVFTT
ncbi:MAG: outer membrane lipoprotein carrier protein LolA [Ruminococcaceae bacterium]|nr:outer membrane lipoprotein carrier protein LolA [Oscillospiraceae bacterium]